MSHSNITNIDYNIPVYSIIRSILIKTTYILFDIMKLIISTQLKSFTKAFDIF